MSGSLDKQDVATSLADPFARVARYVAIDFCRLMGKATPNCKPAF